MNNNTEKNNERQAALYDLTHSRAVYVMSFLIPLVIMIAIFIIRDIFPFGENCYLRSDMYHQYCPFFSELWNKLRNGESLYYSWNIGMGSNFIAIFGYYLSSPVNWLIALFPQKYMIEMMNVIILLKIAASSFTCTFYLCRHNKKRHISAAVFGLFYALSAFTAAYSWNLMWLDCIVLLPLIVLGLENLVAKGKGLLYTITLGLAILSNYYIAIMICITMIIYFVVLEISRPVPDDKTEYAKAILRFAGYSLMAGGLAATLLLPEICALGYTASGSLNFPDTMNRYFSFITVIKRHLMNTEVSIGLDHLPNIYCGVFVLLFFPLYVLCKKIPAREKIVKIIALVIFLTAFNLNIPNFIWHGFHYPNSLPCRQSFIYIFLLLGMCYDALSHIDRYSNSRFTAAFWSVMLFFVYLGNALTGDEDFRPLYTSALFIAIYALILFVMRRKKINRDLLMIGVFAMAIVEVTINMDNTGYSTTSRTAYMSDYESVQSLLKDNTDDSFYRTSKYRGYRSKNDDAWHHFKGASVFSSTAYSAMTQLYGQLGLEHSTNAYAINGATPLIYSIFDIKYLLSNKAINVDNNIYTLLDQDGSEYLYENNYSLPLGFMIPSDFNSKWDPASDSNPFVIQNSFAECAAGVSDLFTRLTFEDNGSSAVINVDKDTYLYGYIMNKTISTITVTTNGVTESFTGVNHGRMVDIGFVKAGSTVNITCNDNGQSLQMYAYSMDASKLKELYAALNDEGLEISSYDSTHISGTINCKSDGLMYTSIPYDKGYSIYVDGVKTPYSCIGDEAFLAIELSAGTHDIEFKYYPQGLKSGRIISIACLLILIAAIVYRIKFKKEITEINVIRKEN